MLLDCFHTLFQAAKLLGPPNASDDPRRRTDLKGKLTVAVERAPRSHVTALLGTEGE